MTIPYRPLNDGRELPAVGLGTYGLRGDEGIASMLAAIGSGYRLLDSALNYRNEREVGEAVRGSGVPRDELVVTSKLPGRYHGRSEARRGIEESLATLGLDRIDLYLIHWPLPRVDKYVETWQTMIEAREEGLLHSIGVSNFTQEQLDRLEAETGVVPAVNQIELHPYFSQPAMREYHEEHGILTESWSPLARKRDVTSEPVLVEIARAHDVTIHQAVLRWHVQLGAVPIPKSADPGRQRENLDVFGFELSEDEMERISALEAPRIGGDPDVHEEF